MSFFMSRYGWGECFKLNKNKAKFREKGDEETQVFDVIVMEIRILCYEPSLEIKLLNLLPDAVNFGVMLSSDNY